MLCLSAALGLAEPAPCFPASQPMTAVVAGGRVLRRWEVVAGGSCCWGIPGDAAPSADLATATGHLQRELFLPPAKTLSSCHLPVLLKQA